MKLLQVVSGSSPPEISRHWSRWRSSATASTPSALSSSFSWRVSEVHAVSSLSDLPRPLLFWCPKPWIHYPRVSFAREFEAYQAKVVVKYLGIAHARCPPVLVHALL